MIETEETFESLLEEKARIETELGPILEEHGRAKEELEDKRMEIRSLESHVSHLEWKAGRANRELAEVLKRMATLPKG